jgi:putative lipoic acid-binding regulatory protein
VAERTDGRIPVEELIEFPARYSFKAIGHHTREFSDRVYAAARDALDESRRVELRTRLSSKGAYLSVTLTTQIESAEELRAVYRSLGKVRDLITLL